MSFNVLIRKVLASVTLKQPTFHWITKPNHYSNFTLKYLCHKKRWSIVFLLFPTRSAAIVWVNWADIFLRFGKLFSSLGFGVWFNGHLIKRIKILKALQRCKTMWRLWVLVAKSVRFPSQTPSCLLSSRLFLKCVIHVSLLRKKKEVGHSLQRLVSMSRRIFSRRKLECCFLQPGINW